MKYAIIVHGRFFAFDLVRALLLRNRDVLLLTNYPKWAVRRFGIHPEYLESFWPHGIVCRFLLCLNRWLKIPFPESLAHRIFGMWAANRLRDSDADVFYCFSGVAEELFAQSRKTRKVRLLARCSAHIRAQRKILVREASLRDVDIAVPSSWMTEREIKEYAMSDGVVVLSQFAQNSFIEYSHSEKGLHLLLLGADLLQFWPSSAVIEARCRRILAGLPLRILYVGTLSHRKGAAYLAEITQALESKNFDFTIVGPVERDARPLLASLRSRVRLVAKQPQSSLHRWYAQADIFIFPTLEDGFPVVLGQAQASSLPIISSMNCSGPDIIEEGKTGWCCPAGDSAAMIDRLRWCHLHRSALAEMVRHLYKVHEIRDWDSVAADFERLAAAAHSSKSVQCAAV